MSKVRHNYTSLQRCLGEGATSSVHEYRDDRTGKPVAVKHMPPWTDYDAFLRSVLREIRLLRTFQHPNIVRLLNVGTIDSAGTLPYQCCTNVAVQPKEIFLVFERMDYSLHDHISASTHSFSESALRDVFWQVLLGIQYLHQSGVAHRDLKPANILMNKDGAVKIADLGLAQWLHHPCCHSQTAYAITRWYRPPELLPVPKQEKPKPYTTAVDMWSIGCMMGEFMLRAALFPGKNPADQLKIIEAKLPRLKEYLQATVSTDLLELVMGLLDMDPTKRWTAERAIDCDFFASPAPTPEYKFPTPALQLRQKFDFLFPDQNGRQWCLHQLDEALLPCELPPVSMDVDLYCDEVVHDQTM